jgi:hypothetical protein
MSVESADPVTLTDLEVIQRWSLAVRQASANRAELIAALRADLDWLEDGNRPAAGVNSDVNDDASDDDEGDEAPAPARTAKRAPSRKTASKTATKTASKTTTRTTTARAGGRTASTTRQSR